MRTRTIEISPDVFAAIWTARRPGEDSEQEILARLLKVTVAKPKPPAAGNGGPPGFSDPRFGFSVPAGFKIHRVYIGRRYEALAENGGWIRTDTDQSFSTLNNLSASIGTKTENVWFHWRYTRKDGSEGRLGELRDRATIRTRRRRRA